LAYTGLADSYYRLSNAYAPPKEALPKARTAAIKALEIDDTLAEAHASLGLIKMYHDWDWAGAEHHYRRALELDPRSVLAHQRYGNYLAMMGRLDESIAILKRGQELDPLSLLTSSLIALTLYLSRQYDKSIEQHGRTLDMDPNYLVARVSLGVAYTQKGMYEEAIAEFQKAGDLEGQAETVAELGYVFAVSGKTSQAHEMLDELKKRSEHAFVSPYNVAKVYVGLGEIDLTFEWLDKAYEERSEWMIWLKVDPKLDCIRSDARFRKLMQRIGL
jgi:tetratricopeptide (TPR) repeat protein